MCLQWHFFTVAYNLHCEFITLPLRRYGFCDSFRFLGPASSCECNLKRYSAPGCHVCALAMFYIFYKPRVQWRTWYTYTGGWFVGGNLRHNTDARGEWNNNIKSVEIISKNLYLRYLHQMCRLQKCTYLYFSTEILSIYEGHVLVLQN